MAALSLGWVRYLRYAPVRYRVTRFNGEGGVDDQTMIRRAFLETLGRAALGAGVVVNARDSRAEQAVPNSAGTAPPALKAPPNACDCHHHIYDPARFPILNPGMPFPPNARVEEYRLLQRRTGTTRSIVVQPGPYITDNRVTLDAIAQLGPGSRGVAVVRPSVTDAELQALDAGGIRGLRFSLNDARNGAVTLDMIEPLSRRVAALGWHVQVNMLPDQIVAAGALWDRLPVPIVFDHLAGIRPPQGTTHQAYAVVRRLLDQGRTWVKLSVTAGGSEDGPPGYADAVRVGQAYVNAAPERLVWGSNWPHPTEPVKPDDAQLFDLMARWVPDARTRHRILVENPEALYGFPAPA